MAAQAVAVAEQMQPTRQAVQQHHQVKETMAAQVTI
jgi:hypothetical protein